MVGGSLPTTFAIVNATVITMQPLAQRGGSSAPVDESDLGIIERAAVVVSNGCIASVGAKATVPPDADVIDAGGRIVMPGFVDAHTHALFAGDRVPDFEAIAAGQRPKLGIAYTVEQTRHRTFDQLVQIGAERLSVMAAHGTTTAEVKTGYALTADGEIAMLRAMHALDARGALPHVVPTFCGAHALPPEFSTYDDFVDALCAQILPQVAKTRLARFADAFCETGYFTVSQSERFLTACANEGMRLRIHADELTHSGGAMLAAKLQCASADHLNFIDAQDIAALARAGSIAVLCPATTEYLELERYAPARALIEAGVPVALATDFNPGTSPAPSLQVVAHLARRRMNMSASEVIAAVTLTAARSLGAVSGVLRKGAPGDVVLLEIRDYREFGYYYGVNLSSAVSVGKPAGAPQGF